MVLTAILCPQCSRSHEWELSEHDVLAQPWPSSVFSLQWLSRRVLLLFHTWLRKTCGRLLPALGPRTGVQPLSDEIFKCSIFKRWLLRRSTFIFALRRCHGFCFRCHANTNQEGKFIWAHDSVLILCSCKIKGLFGVSESPAESAAQIGCWMVLEYDEKGHATLQWLA